MAGHRVQFNARKPGGTHIMNNAVIIDAAAGVFRVELTDQTLAVGNSKVEADITIFTNDAKAILTTRTFVIDVQATMRNDAAVESGNEYGAVVTLFQDVWDMRETIRSINTRFGQPGDGVGAGEQAAGSTAMGALNRIWNYLRTQSTAAIVETVNAVYGIVSQILAKQIIAADSVVRSINRGTIHIPKPPNVNVPVFIDLPLPIVNPSKLDISLRGESYASPIPIFLVQGNVIRFEYIGHQFGTVFHWQVIEYY